MKSILTPKQREQVETTMAEGKTSLCKALKSLSLTSEQKSKLADVFKSLPKKDAFASLTPEQKKQLFMKKNEFFKPTPEEIADFKAKGEYFKSMKGE